MLRCKGCLKVPGVVAGLWGTEQWMLHCPHIFAANSLVAEHILTSDTLWIQKYKILFLHKRHVPFLHENMYCNSILPAPKLEIFFWKMTFETHDYKWRIDVDERLKMFWMMFKLLLHSMLLWYIQKMSRKLSIFVVITYKHSLFCGHRSYFTFALLHSVC